MHVSDLDYDFPPGSFETFPVRVGCPNSYIDEAIKRFMICGPDQVDEVVALAGHLATDTAVVSTSVEADETFRPPRIDLRVTVVDAVSWQNDGYANPENPDDVSVSLLDFIAGSLRLIAQRHA